MLKKIPFSVLFIVRVGLNLGEFHYIIALQGTAMKKITAHLPGICLVILLIAVRMMDAGSAMAAPQKAPLFSGVTIDGKPFSSASLKGKAYIVNFFATWCPPCRSEIPDMVAIQKAYASKGFTFIGIAVSDKDPAVKSFMKSQGIVYPVIKGNQALVDTFSPYIDGGIHGIPTSFVVDSSGNLTTSMVGAQSRQRFEQLINASLSRKPLSK